MFAQKLSSVDELIDYIGTQSVYCTMRGEKYVDFTPVTIDEYFSRNNISGEYFDGEGYRKISFSPEDNDIDHLRTFKFEDLTFTARYRLHSRFAGKGGQRP